MIIGSKAEAYTSELTPLVEPAASIDQMKGAVMALVLAFVALSWCVRRACCATQALACAAFVAPRAPPNGGPPGAWALSRAGRVCLAGISRASPSPGSAPPAPRAQGPRAAPLERKLTWPLLSSRSLTAVSADPCTQCGLRDPADGTSMSCPRGCTIPGDLGITEADVAIFHISLWSSVFLVAATCYAGWCVPPPRPPRNAGAFRCLRARLRPSAH